MPDVTPDQWQKLRRLFESALERDPAQRASYLEEVCAADSELRGQIEALLKSHEEEDDFLEAVAVPLDLLSGDYSEFAEGDFIGPYCVLREIGHGGMGTVFLAARADDQYSKQVAIKVVKRGMDSTEIVNRFKQERQILANLEHPNIARLLDGGTTDSGLPYLVMEYVDGTAIDDYCDTRKLSTLERLNLFRVICAAVHYAHQNLVVHRDLKTSNILVTADGVPKLLDFGISKVLDSAVVGATATVLRVMTPEYASPEQARGGPVTTATDCYSLGVILYELLTGHRPYRVDRLSLVEMERVICESQPRKPSTAVSRNEEIITGDGAVLITPQLVSEARADTPDRLQKRLTGDLDNIVLMALQKEPARRYASVQQFSEDIRRHLEGMPVSARKDTLGYRAGKFVRRHKTGTAAAVLTLLILLGGIIATTREARIARMERERAERRFNQVRTLAHSVLFDYHDAIAELPGSTPLRQRLVKDALLYLDSLAKESGNDVSLQRELATAYQKVGDIQGNPYESNLGDIDGAMRSYQTSFSLREALAKSNPDSVDIKRELADSCDRIGDMLELTHDMNGALGSYNKALSIRESLYSRKPSNADIVRELARSCEMVGEMHMKMGDNPGAFDDYRRSLSLRQTLVSIAPQDAKAKRSLAISYLKVGKTLAALGKRQEGVDQMAESVKILQDLANSDRTNATIQRYLAFAYDQSGDVWIEDDKFVNAVRDYSQGLGIRQKLLDADPQNQAARRDVAVSLVNVSSAMARSGLEEEAVQNSDRMISIFESLAVANANNAAARRDLCEAYGNYGDVYATLAARENPRQKQAQLWQSARSWYERSVSIARDMQKQNLVRGSDADYLNVLSGKIANCDAALAKLR